MREILFRGKGTHGFAKGKWVYGYYLKDFWGENHKGFGIHLIEGGYSEVDPETIGQFTGLTDKNGKKIFEGDILFIGDYNSKSDAVYVEFCEFGWTCLSKTHKFYRHWLENNSKKYEVIGNIHDNPELLKGGVEND